MQVGISIGIEPYKEELNCYTTSLKTIYKIMHEYMHQTISFEAVKSDPIIFREKLSTTITYYINNYIGRPLFSLLTPLFCT